jgi:ABC-type multidrug transport system ATPase subunit
VRLSGGQKQRISIARAFLANPTVLLLDEPTSSVEPDSEAAIIVALDRLMQGRTTVLTSHRPSLINQADYAYVIEDGRVTAEGAPAELRQQGGWFGRFMRSPDGAAAEEVDAMEWRRLFDELAKGKDLGSATAAVRRLIFAIGAEHACRDAPSPGINDDARAPSPPCPRRRAST